MGLRIMKIAIGTYAYVEKEIEMEETEEMRFLRDFDYWEAPKEEQERYDDLVDNFYNELVNRNLIDGEICRLRLDDEVIAEW